MRKTIAIHFCCLLMLVVGLPVFAVSLSATPVEEQQNPILVKGTVQDRNGEPLVGVTVLVSGTSAATMTDINGAYSINVPDSESILKFTYVGYIGTSEKVGERTIINIVLAEDVAALEEVVVIGYGTVKKSNLTGAVSSIGSKDMMADVAKNAASALQGKVPGVSVTNVSGKPGSGMSITIRGISSLTNNSPLYVIDGVYGDINLIDPSDIQSLEVLKDASAAAIYGSRAANGVVIITTKSGKKGSLSKIDVNFNVGVQEISKTIDVMNANQWVNFLKDKGHAEQIAVSKYANNFKGNGTDWQDELYRAATVYKANINISGGSETAIYSASVGYLNQEGIIRNSAYDSFNARLKNEFYFLNNKLKIGESVIFKSSKETGYTDNFLIEGPLRLSPVVPVYDPENAGGYGVVEGWMNNMGNPIASTDFNDNKTRSTEVLFNAYAEAEILDGLKYKLNFGLNQAQYRASNLTKAYDLGSMGKNEMGDLYESSSNYKTWLLEHTINYDKTFGKHTVSGLIGYSSQKDNQHDFNTTRNDLPEGTSSIGAGRGSVANGGSKSTSTILSYFGRAMYSFDSRYMLSASIRRDGSSRFANGHRWGSFPSFSAGWNIHNESFASSIRDVVDELKLRASYGKLGNQQIPNYLTQRTLSGPNYNYTQGTEWWKGSITGYKWVSPENMSWETTETSNIGLDATFFNGKLSLTADAFIQKTKDVLMDVPMPGSAGLGGSRMMNAGTIENKGFELSVTHRNTVDKVFYSITANMSTVSNKVKEITVGGRTEFVGYRPQGLGDITWFKVGEPMGVFRLIKTDGIFQSQEEIDQYKTADNKLIQPNAKPGDIRYVDYNGDGKIDDNDIQTVGKPLPDVAFGLRGSVEWNGFDANFFFDGMVGNSIYNFPRYRIENMNTPFEGYSTTVLNAWTPENRSNSMPRWHKNDPDGDLNNNSRVNSDRWLEKGNYLRLKTLEIGYTLPKPLLKKLSIDRIRVYALFENLFTITKYKGYTPDLGYNVDYAGYEALGRGTDHGRYPQARAFSLGIRVNL